MLPQGVTICGGYIKHSEKKEEYREPQEETHNYDVNSYVKNTTTQKKEQNDDVDLKRILEMAKTDPLPEVRFAEITDI